MTGVLSDVSTVLDISALRVEALGADSALTASNQAPLGARLWPGTEALASAGRSAPGPMAKHWPRYWATQHYMY